MTELSEDRNDKAIRALHSSVCPACGRGKVKNQSFCHGCYYSLPVETRNHLYREFGEGYLEAYEKALKSLKGKCP